MVLCALSVFGSNTDPSEPLLLSNNPDVVLDRARSLSKSNPRLALRYVKRAIEIPMDSIALLQAYNLKGELHHRLGEDDEAKAVLTQASNFRATKLNEVEIALAYNLLCEIFTYQGDLRKALNAGYKARLIFEENKVGVHFPVLYNNLGLLYFRMQNFEKAIFFYQKSIAAGEQSDSQSMAIRYFNLSLCYTELDSLAKAFEAVRRGQSYCEQNCSGQERRAGEHALGMANFREGNIDLAFENFRNSLDASDSVTADQYRGENLRMIGKIYFRKGQSDSALAYLAAAEKIARSSQCNKCLINTYESTIEVYQALGRAREQSDVQQKYIDLKEEMFNSELMRDLAIVEGKHLEKEHLEQIAFQEEQLRAQEEVLKYQAIKVVLVGIVCVLLVVLVIIQIRNVRLKKNIHIRLEEKVKERVKILEEKKRQVWEEEERKRAALIKFTTESRADLLAINKLIEESGDDIGPLDAVKTPLADLHEFLNALEESSSQKSLD